MKTLIVHPKDRTTSFLDIVYNTIPNKTVITGGISKSDLMKEMKSYDRIMMMGHGTPFGLFSVGQFKNSYGYIIDFSFVEVLKEKKDNVFIWCNADQFVNKHKLTGFYSGMFISEVGEANYCGLPGTKQNTVDESNFGFCHILSEYITENSQTIYDNVMLEYGLIAKENPVAHYNHNRLYIS
jgi:hypothetical protein